MDDPFFCGKRDPVQERERQAYVTEQLGCSFVRYDPDAADFNILSVIGRITEKILGAAVSAKTVR